MKNEDEIFRDLIDRQYAFIDLGCGDGESIRFCESAFNVHPGVGFDISDRKIGLARQNGFDVVRANVVNTEFPEDCVSFVSMMDFLEHLRCIEDAKTILARAGQLAKEFLFIRHPNFEDIGYLESFELKLDWTDWSGHRNMMTLADFDAVFHEFGWQDYNVIPRKQIFDSSHAAIVPVDAPTDTVRYDGTIHGPKPFVQFNHPVWSQFDIIVGCSPLEGSQFTWKSIREALDKKRKK